MLVDQARIHVKAGDGGKGSSSFRREKYVPMGGPDGGDGGRGGDVIMRARQNITSLLAFQFNQHFKATPGQAGQGRQKFGKSGSALTIDVPMGTVVYDEETGDVVADLVEDMQEVIVAKGGKGGLGNVHFKSSIRQSPRIAELGEPGEEKTLRLELRIIADVGLVGLPNAGKSTLLAASSAARPKIADYPFTTLEPNLGVVALGGVGGQTFVLADVPGLIEGAADGAGLGHEFLRHVSRTKVLVHVLDASGGLEGRDPLNDFKKIQRELEEYDVELLERPMLIALNKCDLPEARSQLTRLKRAMQRRGLPTFEISAATGGGVQDLLNAVGATLREVEEQAREEARRAAAEPKVYTLPEIDERAWSVERMSRHHFSVSGVGIERFTKMTNFGMREGAERFQRVLERTGITSELSRQGIQNGDIVHVAGLELTWGEWDILKPVDDRPKRRTAAERKAAKKG